MANDITANPDEIDEPISEIFTLVRAKVYSIWPALKFHKIGGKTVIFKDSAGEARFECELQVIVGDQILDFADPPESNDASAGDRIITLDKTKGFYLGNTAVIAPIAGATIGQLKFDGVKHGQIDIKISFKSGDLERLSRMTDQIAVFSETAAYIIGQATGDIVVPILRDQVYAVRSTQNVSIGASSNTMIMQRARSSFTSDQILDAAKIALTAISNLATDAASRLAVAIRRVESAKIEHDVIDAFCDYWEACEFLSPKDRDFNGGKAHLIAKRIAYHMLPNGSQTQRSKAAFLLKTKAVQPMYDIRIGLVHNLREGNQEVINSLEIVSELAHHLIRSWLQADFISTPGLRKLGAI